MSLKDTEKITKMNLKAFKSKLAKIIWMLTILKTSERICSNF